MTDSDKKILCKVEPTNNDNTVTFSVNWTDGGIRLLKVSIEIDKLLLVNSCLDTLSEILNPLKGDTSCEAEIERLRGRLQSLTTEKGVTQ